MRGDSESASKNTSTPIFIYPKYSNIRILENSLASDLVFVGRIVAVSWLSLFFQFPVTVPHQIHSIIIQPVSYVSFRLDYVGALKIKFDENCLTY